MRASWLELDQAAESLERVSQGEGREDGEEKGTSPGKGVGIVLV